MFSIIKIFCNAVAFPELKMLCGRVLLRLRHSHFSIALNALAPHQRRSIEGFIQF